MIKMMAELKQQMLQKCKQKASEKGGKCLSVEYTGSRIPMLWECKNKHQFYSTRNSVQSKKNWCKKCGQIKKTKYTIENMNELAISRGGTCLDIKHTTKGPIGHWRCANNHEWWAQCHGVIHRKGWCNICASNKRRLGIQECIDFAAGKGGKCLSLSYTNNSTKIQWQCEMEHVWWAAFSHIKNGCWCPQCSVLKTQKLLGNIIAEITKCEIQHNFKGFDWLKTGIYGKQEIDIWVQSIGLAVEYDGVQHFKPCSFGNKSNKATIKAFNRTKELDKIKNRKIIQHKKEVPYFVRFNYKEKITKEYVVQKLQKIGIIEKAA